MLLTLQNPVGPFHDFLKIKTVTEFQMTALIEKIKSLMEHKTILDKLHIAHFVYQASSLCPLGAFETR